MTDAPHTAPPTAGAAPAGLAPALAPALAYDRRSSTVDTALAQELLKTAYASHFALCQHYSSVVLQVRIAIMTLVVAAVAMAAGVFPGVDASRMVFGGLTDRSLLAYVAVVLLNLLHAMEVGYMKRYLQVVRSGRDMERRGGIEAFFSRYDRTEAWPLHVAYLLAMIVLMAVFLGAAWSPRDPAGRRAAVAVLAVAPFASYLVSNLRRRAMARELLAPPVARTAS
jgi:hypothetical protein